MTVDSNGRDGTEVLGYRTEGVLGRGGMGVVYRARDVRLRRTVALKVMAPELARDARFRERFVRESELAMSLEHPNVVPIHDAGEQDGRLYLVMRCVEGTDLRALLRSEGALAPERALAIVRQVADALDAAHARGLVHRDVKPSNVLLDASEHAYLADFGLTRRLSEDAPQGEAASLGTPAYLAPEQIEGRPVDGRADVYAVGCLLFECLTGKPPFSGDSRLAVAWAHLEEEPPRVSARNSELPRAIDSVIGKAMAKEPEDRHATCGEFAIAAAEALGLERPPNRRRRVMLLCAAAVVLTALVAAYVARDGADAASSLGVGPNKLIRVDPATNAVSAVIDVGEFPGRAAVAGNSVWVYNLADRTVSEIDARTNEVVHTTSVSTSAAANPVEGQALAADAEGAWLIGRIENGSLLTRIESGGRGTREHRLLGELRAVAVGEGAVWVLAHRDRADFLLRIDVRTGVVTRRTRMPDGVEGASVSAAERRGSSGTLDGLAVGGGFVWTGATGAGTLYRVDPATGAVDVRDFGTTTLRPVFGFGRVWMCVDGVMKWIDPRTLEEGRSGTGLDGEREYVPGYRSMWRHDAGSGTLMRFDPQTGDVAALTRLPGLKSDSGVTSIAAGAGGVWLTVARYY